MRRRNPATASSPNPQFEMTSFMDIIFIFLFVVMVGYALKCAEVRDNAEDKMAEAEEKLEEARQMRSEAGGLAADLAAYEKQLQNLQGAVVGSRVQIVTLICTYDTGDAKEASEWARHLRVIGSDGKMLMTRDFKESTAQNAYEKLREVLGDYVKSVKKQDREELGERYESAKQERTVVIFAISREEGGILTRDYEEISAVIRDLEKEYDDVY